MKKRYIIQEAEAGNYIDSYYTLNEAEKAVKEYEEEDKKQEDYAPGFYEIEENEDYISAYADINKADKIIKG